MTLPASQTETHSIARNATIISLGNITSRILGLVRDTVKSHYFGATGAVSAYELAIIVPVTIYDLLIGGMISSALVPIFSEYIALNKKEDLWQLAGTLLATFAMVLAVFVVIVQLLAPAIADFMAPSYSPELRALFIQLLRILVFSLFFLSLSAVITGVLNALKRFTLPAFTAALFNLGIVMGALLFHEQLGVTSLAIGLLVGAFLQVVVQLPGLRGAQLHLFLPNWNHPGLKQIAKLYLPIILGLLISNFAVLISAKLMASTGERSIAWNDYATSLMQFPLGLVVTGISVAILPTLSQRAVGELKDFKLTLAQGLNLVLVLITPAVVGMILLAHPINALIYEHGSFTSFDTDIVSIVLRVHMIGVFFAALDQPLIFAFYARKDTLTPALVGVASMVAYLSIAYIISLIRPIQLFDLVAANSAQLATHALLMIAIFRNRLGDFENNTVWILLIKVIAASAVMALIVWVTSIGLNSLTLPNTLISRAADVFIPSGIGVIVYFFLAAQFKMSEAQMAIELIRRKLNI